tara:strand:- start:1358 stop:1759 length:402 start_codon:yes stop_codon:yes gene_type:complete
MVTDGILRISLCVSQKNLGRLLGKRSIAGKRVADTQLADVFAQGVVNTGQWNGIPRLTRVDEPTAGTTMDGRRFGNQLAAALLAGIPVRPLTAAVGDLDGVRESGLSGIYQLTVGTSSPLVGLDLGPNGRNVL